MKVRNKLTGKIGIIKDWNKSLNGKVCIVVYEINISYNKKYDICKVLIDNKIHTVPKHFIKICTSLSADL